MCVCINHIGYIKANGGIKGVTSTMQRCVLISLLFVTTLYATDYMNPSISYLKDMLPASEVGDLVRGFSDIQFVRVIVIAGRVIAWSLIDVLHIGVENFFERVFRVVKAIVGISGPNPPPPLHKKNE